MTAADVRALRMALRLERARREAARAAPGEWRPWLRTLFPAHVTTFAAHHEQLWEWVWGILPGVRPRPLVEIISRGGGKSTSAELATVGLGTRGVRRYAWYVRETQDQADKSVENVGSLLESNAVERHYPRHSQRKVGKYGASRGWRRNRLRTAGGFTVDALGLDKASRGVKVEEQRPDLIILDDLDGKHDTERTITKKIQTLTHSILPAGTDSLAIMAIQNLIHPHGIFARLVDGRADFLVDRIMVGPIPAVEGLETQVVDDPELGRRRAMITGGTPTWDGQDLQACQRFVDTFGLRAFLEECQHQVDEREGALWKKSDVTRTDTAPPLRRVVVGVDPSGGGAEIGIVAAGLGHDGRGYVLGDFSQKGALGALNWGRTAVGAYDDLEGDRIVAEANFGGNMVESNIKVAAGKRRVPVTLVSASRGKAVRAEPVSALYQDGLIDHVGTFPELEAEMTGWVPGDPDSPNRLDALVWCLTDLMLTEKRRVGGFFPGMKVEGRNEDESKGEAA